MNKIGIDVGWTIKGVKSENDRFKPSPNCFRIITSWINRGDDIFIISKVNSYQKKEVEEWLEKNNFFNITGVKPENLYFCFERRDKSLFVKALNINIMIDDRPEVMAYLDYDVIKFLISPDEKDLNQYKDKLFNTKIVYSWLEIEQSLSV
jgi:hypothetical protein